jgi:hypothetical protein
MFLAIIHDALERLQAVLLWKREIGRGRLDFQRSIKRLARKMTSREEKKRKCL